MSRILFMTAALLGLSLFASGSAQAEDAKVLFNFYCAQCHGVEGTAKGVNATKEIATTPRDFTNKVEMAKRTDEDIRTVIKGGGPSISKSALMPPWGKTISNEDVEKLLVYVRHFAK